MTVRIRIANVDLTMTVLASSIQHLIIEMGMETYIENVNCFFGKIGTINLLICFSILSIYLVTNGLLQFSKNKKLNFYFGCDKFSKYYY